MAGHANFIEVSMKLIDDGCNLLGEIAGIHGGGRQQGVTDTALPYSTGGVLRRQARNESYAT